MKKRILTTLYISATILFGACTKETPALPDNLVNFESTETGIDDSELSKTIVINLSRKVETNAVLTLKLSSDQLTYGTEFTTIPVAVDQLIPLTIEAGTQSVSVTIQKTEGIFFAGSEKIALTLETIDPLLTPGSAQQVVVSFGAIVSQGSELVLQGGEGGSSAANSVFADLSNNAQTVVARKLWNLGFYCGNQFAVILNNTTSATAVEATHAIDQVVSQSDSAAYAATLAYSTANTNLMNLVDHWTGDLKKTVIQEGKTYIMNLGESQTPLYKVRVTTKDANTYTLQYAKINESTVTTIQLAKSTKHHFVYASFAQAQTVEAEPQSAKWDVRWSRTVYRTLSGTDTIAYTYPDFVVINHRQGVKAAEVVSADATSNIAKYDGFTAADAAALTLSGAMNVIGSNWRNGGGPTTTPTVKTDRFYVVRDPAGNIYKLQFVSLGEVRGYPKIKYTLLQQGS